MIHSSAVCALHTAALSEKKVKNHSFFQRLTFFDMENHKQFIQFPCGWALFEPDSEDEATDGWCANYEEQVGNDEYEEPEVDGAYQGPVDQEGHITLLSDEVKSYRCFFFFKVLIISVR